MKRIGDFLKATVIGGLFVLLPVVLLYLILAELLELAVILATPCSAPFLATAIGFALASSDATVLLLFSVLGLGLASPLVVPARSITTVSDEPFAFEFRVMKLSAALTSTSSSSPPRAPAASGGAPGGRRRLRSGSPSRRRSRR